MKIKEFFKAKEKKIYIRIGVIAGAAMVFALTAGMQKICLGQNYFEIIVDNKVVGTAYARPDTEELLKECRRELTELVGTPVCFDVDIQVREGHTLFTSLENDAEIKADVFEAIKSKVVTGGTFAYTVNINDFTASFATLEEASEFFSQVKQEYDAQNQFAVTYETDSDHSEETFSVNLVNKAGAEETEAESTELTAADKLTAGSTAAERDRLSYAMQHPGEKNYETGLVNLGFTQKVAVYTDFVEASELTDVAAAVEQVTKEEETNKIYEVEAGDCLSTIAEENDTTVDKIMALNGFTDVNAYICIGDEIIISVPEPELSVWKTEGIVYEEDYTAEPTIVGNDSWYTTKQVVLQEGTVGHREVNVLVTYEDGVETERTMAHQTILAASTPAVIEQGTQIPPTYVKPIYGGRFTSGFGERWGRMHKGVDWACPIGTTVYASSDGVVEFAGWTNGYGYNVIIDHPDGRKTRYCHLSETLVTPGESVSQGEKIALSGNTGRSTGPHVHFEIYINGTQVNPLEYIN